MKKILKVFKYGVIFFFASTVLAVLYYKWMPVRRTPLMFIRNVQQFSAGKRMKTAHSWVPLQDMAPSMSVAVIASEDQNFLKHHGFDVHAIAVAIEEQESGKRVRGGSTISQQTAKNVFLWPSATWVRKGFEAYFTLLIEMLWSKERIMEVYLNSIEMGDGIYGVEAVAEEHFHCNAAQLSRADCALIAATLPNPLKFDSAHPSAYMRQRQSWVMGQMRHIPAFRTAVAADKSASRSNKSDARSNKSDLPSNKSDAAASRSRKRK